ncbi:MAG: penicillin-binding transpeptidase domain-containing protein, partial [Candidatus Paceibacterota bacterium]
MPSSSTSTKRIRLISLLLLTIGVILVGKLYFLQIVHGQSYNEKAERQYQKPNDTTYDRGTIFFKNKDGSTVGAATLKSGFTLAANPKTIQNPEETYAKISSVLPIEKESFIAKISKKDDPYEEILKKVDTESAQKINSFGLPGISIYKDKWRYYPAERLTSQVLGFVGFNSKNISTGQYGLERQYEDTLNRTNDSLYTNFFVEIFSGAKKMASGADFEGDIVTTIEPTVQSTLETVLSKIAADYSSKITGGIIMDPKTGEIYAMATVPNFDPNNFQNEKNPAVFTNQNVEGSFEMGSVVKPLTIAAGIDAGVITSESEYYDNGFITLNGKTFW